MANWTTPKTWTSEVLKSADMNTHLRDNITYAKEAAEDASIGAVIDGGGAAIAAGTAVEVEVPCTSATILWASARSDESIDSDEYIIVDVRRLQDSDADNAFTSDDEIITGLTLDTDTGRYDTQGPTSDWGTSLLQKDWLQFYVADCAGITKATVQLGIHKEA